MYFFMSQVNSKTTHKYIQKHTIISLVIYALQEEQGEKNEQEEKEIMPNSLSIIK